MISIETVIARAHSAAFRTYMVYMHVESPDDQVARAARSVSEAVFRADMLAVEAAGRSGAVKTRTWMAAARRAADAAEAAALVTRSVAESGAAASGRAEAALAAEAVVPPSLQLSATRQDTWERKAEKTEAWAVRTAWDAFGRVPASCGLPPRMVMAGMALREGGAPQHSRALRSDPGGRDQPVLDGVGLTTPAGSCPPVP
ncbi:hypothetical protein [Streptomyces albidus (ex Kaewkla and Franco 2022)]|uniref:hypothetical protein n=1 Tax=Streptomyces albidus (ex Kaewkla and Franco 2022) TaxID=722709 RepID=UPI0015EEDC9C|nr:hypothetical protein [Streptomyces albidus (ex Kaewkla and Franco 2022)]